MTLPPFPLTRPQDFVRTLFCRTTSNYHEASKMAQKKIKPVIADHMLGTYNHIFHLESMLLLCMCFQTTVNANILGRKCIR